MTGNVMHFRELTPGLLPFTGGRGVELGAGGRIELIAGGKGGKLALMYQAGYPVPEGFIIFPSGFSGEAISNKAWHDVLFHLNKIRKNNRSPYFAVRSSALNEDSQQASFAGEFETVLMVKTDKEIRDAINKVFHSRKAERVKVYTHLTKTSTVLNKLSSNSGDPQQKSTGQDTEPVPGMAVVIQKMVQPEISGVLFTADPVTGSFTRMAGNYVNGQGEQLVAGEANAFHFTLIRPGGTYQGPGKFKKYARRLFRYASRLEKEYGTPQDIEWAVEKGKIYLLQARPITTLTTGNTDTYEMNYSYGEDGLWINTNVAEAMPDVLSPFTWSIGKQLDEVLNFIPGYYIWSGNICGRAYMNINRRISVISSFLGKHNKNVIKMIGDFYGKLPETITLPLRLFSRLELIKVMLPRILRLIRISLKASGHIPQFLQRTPAWCREIRERIGNIDRKEELLAIWKDELQPNTLKAWLNGAAAGSRLIAIMNLDKKLTNMIGTEDTNILLSNLRGSDGLASLGPVVGISKIIKGEITQEEYIMKYGHRGPHEYELSVPGPVEDPGWLKKQIAKSRKGGPDVGQLLKKQYQRYEAAKLRFKKRFPHKAAWLDKKLAKASEAARYREELRSEFVRIYRIIRAFALKAGELTGIGNDVFFLYIKEVEDLLSGKDVKIKFIPVRKENFRKYQALPPFPSIIRGRFNPFEWAQDPDRRLDYYDAAEPVQSTPDSRVLKGYAGAAGKVEGVVRVLEKPEQGEELQPGEILVAITTNIGWTPVFPLAAAIITDIGAPLSHAAIVARELGIPAVVGCGNATTILKTGDRIIVDGGQGIVHILK